MSTECTDLLIKLTWRVMADGYLSDPLSTAPYVIRQHHFITWLPRQRTHGFAPLGATGRHFSSAGGMFVYAGRVVAPTARPVLGLFRAASQKRGIADRHPMREPAAPRFPCLRQPSRRSAVHYRNPWESKWTIAAPNQVSRKDK